MIRAGDTFFVKRTGEMLLCAYNSDGYVAWFGWPPGEYHISECELVRACTDEEHRAALEEWAKPRNGSDGMSDRRRSIAKQQLFELNRGYVGAFI